MKIWHFCLLCDIPVISNLIRVLYQVVLSLIDFYFATSFNIYILLYILCCIN